MTKRALVATVSALSLFGCDSPPTGKRNQIDTLPLELDFRGLTFTDMIAPDHRALNCFLAALASNEGKAFELRSTFACPLSAQLIGEASIHNSEVNVEANQLRSIRLEFNSKNAEHIRQQLDGKYGLPKERELRLSKIEQVGLVSKQVFYDTKAWEWKLRGGKIRQVEEEPSGRGSLSIFREGDDVLEQINTGV